MSREENEPLLGSAGEPCQPRSNSLLGRLNDSRKGLRRYLGTKWGHYTVIVLVTIDVGCIFADFMINLYLCERECNGRK